MSNHSVKILCVDLDHTLIRSDLLVESFICALRTQTRLAIKALWVLFFRGRLAFKQALANVLTDQQLKQIPRNLLVWEYCQQRKKDGTLLILCTGTPQSLAQRYANQWDIFDKVYGSTDKINNVGLLKKESMVEHFGERGFEYIGDSNKDIPTWDISEKAHYVRRSRSISKKIHRYKHKGESFPYYQKKLWHGMVRAIRPHQWLKNLILFIPLITSHQIDQTDLFLRLVFGFFCFSFAASAVYLLNDLLDVDNDRLHPTKCHRPIASGEFSIVFSFFFMLALASLAFILAYPLDRFFGHIILFYFSLNVAYSLYLKQKAVIDVFCLAVMFTLRIFAGSVLASIVLTNWLLTFSMLIFLSLAILKRYSEVIKQPDEKNLVPGRGYTRADMPLLLCQGVGLSLAAVLVFVLYINHITAIRVYQHPNLLWVSAILILYWSMRAWLLATRKQIQDDPIAFAAKDGASWIIALGATLCFYVAV